MEPCRRIAAAADFSPRGGQAARRAAQLAAAHGAELTLVHVLEADAQVVLRDLLQPGRDFPGAIARQAEMGLEVLASTLPQGLPVRRLLRTGNAVDELKAISAEADVLVLGAHGHSTVRGLVLGRTAERLVRVACGPVLVVRGAGEAPYRRVLVATDFSPSANWALQAALRLAPEASILLMHCYEPTMEGKLRLAGATDAEIGFFRDRQKAAAQRQLDATLQGVGDRGRISTIVREGDTRTELLLAEKELSADLVAVGKQGTSLIGDTLLGSVSSWALAQAAGDVLVVPASAMTDAAP